MGNKIAVRLASKADLESVLTILDETAQALLKKGTDYWEAYRKDSPWHEKFGKPHVEECVRKHQGYIVKVDGALIGTFNIGTVPLALQQELDGISVPWKAEGDALYLSRVAVRPQEEGKGYATQILAFVEDAARRQNLASVRLDTVKESEGMRNLAIRKGYGIVHERQEKERYRFFLEKAMPKL